MDESERKPFSLFEQKAKTVIWGKAGELDSSNWQSGTANHIATVHCVLVTTVISDHPAATR